LNGEAADIIKDSSDEMDLGISDEDIENVKTGEKSFSNYNSQLLIF